MVNLYVIPNVIFLFLFYFYFNTSAVKEKWPSIQEMNSYFEKHFLRENGTTVDKWYSALPNEIEMREISELIQFLIFKSNFKDMDPVEILNRYPSIANYVDLEILQVSVFKLRLELSLFLM